MIIDWQLLNEETLTNLLESFILREGTDYGEEEYSLHDKRQNLLNALKAGKVSIHWSELHETFDIKPNH